MSTTKATQTIQQLRDQIATWHNRADMAKQAGLEELRQQALDRAAQYKQKLDEIMGNEPDENDQDSAPVSRRPYPDNDEGAAALSYPDQSNDEISDD